MTMTTPMPRACVSSHDSVEDFASPLKKFKVDKDLVGEDHSTDSAIELTHEEAFRIWCKVQRKDYPNDKEKQWRFQVFQSNLVNTPYNPIPGALTYPSLADQTEAEFEEFCEKYELHQYDEPMNNKVSFEEIIIYRDYDMPEDKDNTPFPTHLY